MSYHKYPPSDASFSQWNNLDSNTSLSSILLAVVAGAYVLVKSLELLGYPAGLWIRRIVQMSVGVLRPRGDSLDSSGTDSSEDSMQRSGGMLSSIFGLNSDSLLQKGVRGLAGALSGGSSNVPPGLGNISNSCYQNSVIQGLAALPSLRDYLAQMTTEHPSLTPETTNGALHDMIRNLNDPKNHGQNFWVRGKLKSMSTFQQQDAQEYYSKVLDELDNEVKKVLSSKRRSSVSWVEATKSLSDLKLDDDKDVKAEKKNATDPMLNVTPNPLDGLIAQRVGCISCGYSEGLSLITFNCITVSLGNRHGYVYDIRECLDEYTSLEHIDGVECAKCTLLKLRNTLAPLAKAKPGSPFETRLTTVTELLEDEKFDDNDLVKTLNIPKKNWVQTSKSKQIVIARAPKSLVLHVNRSIFDEMTGAMYKNNAGVSYPETLDLGHWCLGSSPSGSRRPDISPEEWPRDPSQSMLPSQEDEPMTSSPFQYKLRAAVTHAGSHGYGHYICYRPHVRSVPTEADSSEDTIAETSGPTEQWWRFSDDNVYAVPEEQAHQGNVFMLFYERIDQSTSPTPVAPPTNLVAIPADAPLPPSHAVLEAVNVLDMDALEVPLPDEDDDLLDLIPPESPTTPTLASPILAQDSTPPATLAPSQPHDTTSSYPTPPPDDITSQATAQDADPETSEAESEDAPSTNLTSDSESDLAAPLAQKHFVPMPPHMMRTAGNAGARGRGDRQSLPLVSAT